MTKLSLAKNFIDFVNSSPTPFHCVQSVCEILNKSGFKKISENNIEDWGTIQPKNKYYFTRNQTSIIAFTVGGKYKKGNGFTCMASHSDSPGLTIKPISKIKRNDYLTVGCEIYGGGLFNTWFDRDLSVSGRVIYKVNDENKYTSKLIKIERPIMFIPNLAIHLRTSKERTAGFLPNYEKHLRPILGLENKSKLLEKNKYEHHLELMELIASEVKCEIEDISSMKLFLYDTHKSCIGGINNEFIFSPRLDNQLMSFIIVRALVESSELTILKNNENINIVSIFDNEEVGSVSNRGANSRFLLSIFERISGKEYINDAINKSILISTDMAHAIHPNYIEKHEENHKVMLNKGLTIKYDTNERYSTTDLSSFFLIEIAKLEKIRIQKFCIKQDSRSGSTIGPALSSNIGIRTIDVGIPQLAMHSIREMCGINDLNTSLRLLTKFFEKFPDMDKKLKIE